MIGRWNWSVNTNCLEEMTKTEKECFVAKIGVQSQKTVLDILPSSSFFFSFDFKVYVR